MSADEHGYTDAERQCELGILLARMRALHGEAGVDRVLRITLDALFYPGVTYSAAMVHLRVPKDYAVFALYLRGVLEHALTAH